MSIMSLAAITLVLFMPLAGADAGEASSSGTSGYSIPWSTLNPGGGINSTGSTFAVSGAVAEPSVAMSGGDYRITGGFWAVREQGSLFEDGFESGDTSAWSTTNG